MLVLIVALLLAIPFIMFIVAVADSVTDRRSYNKEPRSKLKRVNTQLKNQNAELEKTNAKLIDKNTMLMAEVIAYRNNLAWVNVEETDGSKE